MNQAVTTPGATADRADASVKPSVTNAGRNLNALDRCDRCGAQAYHLTVSPESGSELLFCHHHGQKIVPVLKEKGWITHDYSKRLLDNAKPDASPM